MFSDTFFQLLLAGITVGSLYSLMGMGFNTVYRCSGMVNFAQGHSAMIAAMVVAYLLARSPLPYAAAAILGVTIAVFLGVVFYEAVLRRVRSGSLMAVVMGSIGVGMLMENSALIAFGVYPLESPPFTGYDPIRIGEVAVSKQALWMILATAAIVLGLYLLNNRTLLGKLMTATATDDLAASLIGVDTARIIRYSFAISAAVGAVGGIVLAPIVPVFYASGMSFTMMGFIAAVIGGWGRSSGAVVGGLTLGLVETFGAGYLSTSYRGLIPFAALLLILALRPSGLLGASLTESGTQ